jgi:FkbM family methyltransferase
MIAGRLLRRDHAAHLRSSLKWAARKVGFEIHRYSPDKSLDARRSHLLAALGIREVLDVGANTGQFGAILRRSGYAGSIVSVEPIWSAFDKLLMKTQSDANWTCHNIGLGSVPATMDINVSANSYSSSFLKVTDTHLAAAPDAKYIHSQVVEVSTLDHLVESFQTAPIKRYLKIDAQGYELRILEGGQRTLRTVEAIEVEVSLVALYEDQPLYRAIIDKLESTEFSLTGLYPGYSDPATGRMLQMDAIFVKRAARQE